jgi:basic membrane lipoprotein Med (substrate-binding protein (PBP1-ABC) superfamily)
VYNLVFGHGFEFQDAALRVAPEFPRTITSRRLEPVPQKNVAGMEIRIRGGSYLAGMMAGAITKTV